MSQDVSQNVFLKAYDKFSEIGDSPGVGGWLKTVTRNMCLNHLARYRNRWRLFSDFKSDGDGDDREFDQTLADERAEIAGRDNSNDQ